MDRNWITDGVKFTPQYMRGVAAFMNFARQHVKEGEPMLCPCTKCLNLLRQKEDIVESHINCNGMTMHYKRWIFHGEPFSDDESNEGAYESDDYDSSEQGSDNFHDDVDTMVHDLEESSKKGSSEPNLYAKLIEEAKRELHKGCSTTSRLMFIIKMLYIKSYNRVTNRAFDQFFGVLCDSLPGVSFPRSYVEAIPFLMLGLGMRLFMYASMIVLCFGEIMLKNPIALCVDFLDGGTWKERERFLIRCLGTFL
jgi:hypothetical protein